MADESLTNKITAEARPLSLTDLPSSFSYPLQDFLLRMQSSEQLVVDQANSAAGGAYDAQVAGELNAEQIKSLSIELDLQDKRIFTVEQVSSVNAASISQINASLSDFGADLTTLDARVEFLENDYVSITKTTQQSLASSLNVTDSYSVNGIKVIGEQVTGWTAGTGTPNRGPFNADATYTISPAYNQAELQALSAAVTSLQQRVLALEFDLRSHGLID